METRFWYFYEPRSLGGRLVATGEFSWDEVWNAYKDSGHFELIGSRYGIVRFWKRP